jgi:hypothetical protein
MSRESFDSLLTLLHFIILKPGRKSRNRSDTGKACRGRKSPGGAGSLGILLLRAALRAEMTALRYAAPAPGALYIVRAKEIFFNISGVGYRGVYSFFQIGA